MKVILQFLLYCPRVYSGLDRLMIELAKYASPQGYNIVCVYCDTMDYMPIIQRDLEKAGGVVELISASKSKQPRDILHLYRKYHPIVVNTHFDNHVKIISGFYSRCFRAAHFTYMHSLIGEKADYRTDKGALKTMIASVYYRILSNFSKRVLCASDAILHQYHSWCCTVSQIEEAQRLYLGTRLQTPRYSKVEARKIVGLPQDATIITNVSAIEPIKGIDLILRAVAQLKQQGKDIFFVHIGGLRTDSKEQQMYADSLRELASSLQIENRVLWLGKRMDVQDILPMADVYIHPSYSEGLGVALLEASVAALSLVGTNVGGIPEVVIDGQTGRLVDKGNTDQLAKAIVYVRQHPEYGQAAYDYVYTHFDQSVQADKLLNMYISAK